jgi:hypothetical protein
MTFHKFTAKLSHLIFRFLKGLINFLDAAFSGFWLGVMSRKSFDFSDELYYNRNKNYTDDKYNLSGLFNWEKAMIEKHFSSARTILLIAAGGGREVLALSRMGLEVDSYECNAGLVEYGNAFLEKNKNESRIKYLPRNAVPVEIKKYDGIIIGWGAYSHIQGNRNRLSFLERLYPFMHKESRLMISFLWVHKRTGRDKIVKNVSNFFRMFTKKDKTEPGDKLEPGFIHYFIEDEIKGELTRAKYNVLDYYASEYGCLIAGI